MGLKELRNGYQSKCYYDKRDYDCYYHIISIKNNDDNNHHFKLIYDYIYVSDDKRLHMVHCSVVTSSDVIRIVFNNMKHIPMALYNNVKKKVVDEVDEAY